MTNNLFAVRFPYGSLRFLINADNLQEAQTLVGKWNAYHGYAGDADCECTAHPATEEEAKKTGWIHNEYVDFL